MTGSIILGGVGMGVGGFKAKTSGDGQSRENVQRSRVSNRTLHTKT